MRYDHNQICTKDKEVNVGDRLQYYEDGFVADVTVLAEERDDKGIGFKLLVDRPLNGIFKAGEVFSCWAAHGRYAYSGMWRLYPLGEYQVVP